MISPMLRTKGALFEYMQSHPNMYLEFCSSVRSHSWWWVRDRVDSTNTVDVHANAAIALRRQGLVKESGGDWCSIKYVLA